MVAAERRLAEKGLSITKPRVAILHYLMTHHTHPIVDTIYRDLIPEFPNLSRTTIYNTVKTLCDCGLIQMLTIDEKQICVDENTTPHGHFLCTKCGRVIDVPIQGVTERNEIDGNRVTEVHQYYKGVCKECLEMGDRR